MNGEDFGVKNIHYWFPYEIEDDAPSPPPPSPDEERFVLVLSQADENLLPPDVIDGDAAISTSDLGVYSVNSPTIATTVREVIVVSGVDPIPEEAIPGDVVYDETTNDLYQVGE